MSMEMYQQNIIDHYKDPRNKAQMDDATVVGKDNNPTCGDFLVLQLKIEENKITDVKFQGTGCAISQSAISMLTEKLVGLSIDEARKIDRDYIFKLLGVPISHARINCALLSLKVLKLCVYNEKL